MHGQDNNHEYITENKICGQASRPGIQAQSAPGADRQPGAGGAWLECNETQSVHQGPLMTYETHFTMRHFLPKGLTGAKCKTDCNISI